MLRWCGELGEHLATRISKRAWRSGLGFCGSVLGLV
jgi:hypothetical protein